jgi:hypothetical protein
VTWEDDASGATALTIKPKYGKVRTVDLSAFERTRNPDKWVTYGIPHPTKCQQEAFEPLGGATYRGLVDPISGSRRAAAPRARRRRR